MRSRRFPSSLRAQVVLAATLLLGACAPNAEPPEPRPRAVVIGIDGADWRVIDALAAEGRLPNLTALRSRGVSGPIRTLNDIALSPVIWTSMATGKTAAKHGITWFMVDRPDGTRVPVRSTNRRTRAIWNILAQQERSVGVLGWWATYPAEDVGPGVVVSDALGFHGFGATARDGDDGAKTWPPELFAAVDALVPTEQQVAAEFVQRFVHLSAEEYRAEMFDPARFPKRDPTNPIHLFQQYAVTAQGYTRIAEQLLEERSDDLFLMYFEQVDSLSHLFMKHAPPRLEWIDERAFDRYRDVVREWYVYQDELLGRVLAKVDLERTAVFVVSDHGFKSGERRIQSDQVVDVSKAHLDHEEDGILLAAGPGIRRGGVVEGASVLDLTPTLLHYLELPVGKDMDGKVLLSLFEDDFVDAHPVRYVPTYETEGERRPDLPVASIEGPEASEVEAGLRALGYVGDEADDGEPQEEAASETDGAESSPEIRNNLGRIHLRNGDLAQALVEFEGALALDPGNAEALLNIAAIHRAEGRELRARAFIDRALARDPSSIGALAQLAELERDEGELGEAIRLFEEALAIDDSQPFLYLGWGDVLQRAGRYAEAVEAFRTVLLLDPDSFQARYNLGVTFTNMGRVDEAVETFEEALAANPQAVQAPAARNNLGAILLERGEVDRALDHFEAARRAAPGNLEATFNAALIRYERGELEEAIRLWELATDIDPKHEQANLRLGMAYLEALRDEDAYRPLLLVRRLYPGNWVAALGLAVLHARADQHEVATELLDASIRLGGDAARELARSFPRLSTSSRESEARTGGEGGR